MWYCRKYGLLRESKRDATLGVSEMQTLEDALTIYSKVLEASPVKLHL
jgi:hypothetical protein